ncbi:MAG: hypothetical protein ABJG47_00200 [Ekhidna sp.]
MKYNLFALFLIATSLSLPSSVFCQNFEGSLSYRSYSVLESGDTIASSTMNYWIKEHLFKYAGYVVKAPLLDLGTLYADANKMIRTNINHSGKVDKIPISQEPNLLTLEIKAIDEYEDILDYKCQLWKLIDIRTDSTISTIWVTKEIRNSNYDQFVKLFNYQSTLFPCTGINGWILKREDYRREGEIFVSEATEVKEVELNIAEMVAY